VINRAAARRFFPGRSAVGHVLREQSGRGPSQAWTVVGVVEDAIYDSVRSGVPPTLYEPLGVAAPVSASTLTVRAARGSPAALARGVVSAVTSLDPKLGVSVQPLDARLAAATARERLLAYLSGFFAALALMLAALGLYGVVSYDVSRRQREIGIRLALGAGPSRVAMLLARRIAWLVGVGVAIGVPLGAWSARFIATLLFGLDARDVATFAGAAALLIVVAALAVAIPARRATRLDPTEVLRQG
jgi:predicted lysophospholipase L1 biosynthesis ABC-type transport system permease subunit